MSASVAADVSAESAALEALLVSRTYLYMLFHKLFAAAPDEDVLEALLAGVTADAVGEYAEDDATMRGLTGFLAELAGREDRARLLDEAKDEFTRLFIGPGALPAPTWESPYRTGEPTLFQESTLAVRDAYRRHGLEPKRIQRVPDDHVALLCAFMAARAGVGLAVLRTGDAAALAVELRDELPFVEEHLANWLGAFAERTRASKTAVLYPQMIEAAAAFAGLDAVFLAQAAYWAEGLAAASAVPSELGCEAGSADAASLAAVEVALVTLEAARPFGIEDYELAPAPRRACAR